MKTGSLRLACGATLTAILALFAAAPAAAQVEAQPIPISELKAKCGLDPDVMAGIDNYLLDNIPYSVFRNGHFCWRSNTLQTSLLGLHNTREVFSTTKSFGAILVGTVISRSSLNDDSLLRDWLTPGEISAFNPNINPNARVAHVLAMTATSPNLAYGQKNSWSYDALGDRELNILIPLLDRAIQREPAKFWGATTAKQLAEKLFAKLGMTQTSWAGESIGASLQSTSSDLARLAELVLRKGRWAGEQIVDEKFMYRMTHASFEDSNTGLGYLFWLNAGSNSIHSDVDHNCSPYPRWARYPHVPFYESPNSNGGFPFGESLETMDIGAAWSAGLNGSSFIVHRGLDMVMGVNMRIPNLLEGPTPSAVWNNVRPALIAALPEFANNERGFCDVYRMGLWGQVRSPWSASASL